MKTQLALCLASVLLGACASTPSTDTSGVKELSPTALHSVSSLTLAPDTGRDARAQGTLGHVREILAKGGGRGIGFESAADLDGATLGDAIPVYALSGAAVQSRTIGTDPHALLGEPVEIMYPVVSAGQVKSSVVMEKNANGDWDVTSVGRAPLARSMESTRQTLTPGNGAPPVALVVSHDLGTELVAHEEGGDVKLTSMTDLGSAHWAKGETVDSETAFTRLADYANVRATRAR